jgi:hypothetical protein
MPRRYDACWPISAFFPRTTLAASLCHRRVNSSNQQRRFSTPGGALGGRNWATKGDRDPESRPQGDHACGQTSPARTMLRPPDRSSYLPRASHCSIRLKTSVSVTIITLNYRARCTIDRLDQILGALITSMPDALRGRADPP